MSFNRDLARRFSVSFHRDFVRRFHLRRLHRRLYWVVLLYALICPSSQISVFSNKMQSIVEVSKNIAICGQLTSSTLVYVKEKYKSVVYLCPDRNGDSGYENGSFENIFEAFGTENSAHVQFEPSFLPSEPFKDGSKKRLCGCSKL